jgi:hypothetical protein
MTPKGPWNSVIWSGIVQPQGGGPAEPTVDNALTTARIYLNDTEKISWSDPNLIPFVQEACRELQNALALNDIEVIRYQLTNPPNTAGIHLYAGQTNLANAGLQPVNLIEPIEVSERDWGDTTPEDYLSMQRVPFLPNYTQNTYLYFWTWQQDSIQFTGATTDRDLQIRYRAKLMIPSLVTDSLGFLGALTYCGPRTAALAYMTRGNSAMASAVGNVAKQNLDDILRTAVKNDQGTAVRRIPYRRRGRVRVY